MSRARPVAIRKRSGSAKREVVDGVRRLERGLRLAARKVEMATGLSAAQLFVLEHLVDEPAESLADLAQRTMTDRSSVSVAVERLEDGGYVERKPSEGDKRRFQVRITPSGRAMLRRAPSPPTELLVRALRSLPPGTVRSLGRALGALNERLGFSDAPLLFESE